MSIGIALSRALGLLVLSLKCLLLRGRASYGPTLLVAPSIRLFLARGSRLVLGQRVVIAYDADICALNGACIDIGDRAYLGPRCMLSAHSGIRIGEHCLFGPDVKIFDNNHEFVPGTGVVHGRHRSAAVRIGANVWVGANVVILKGVSIGDGAVIGAGCVVRKDVPAGAVVGAGPARAFAAPDAARK